MYMGRDIWDPVLIIAQLITNQFSFYLIQSLWIIFLTQLGGKNLNLAMLFAGRSVSLSHTSSWVCIVSHILTFPLWYVGYRSMFPSF
jgi:hypothetical protein